MTGCFVLSNARCLSEGVDVPSLDGVAFIDPKHSPIDIVQAVGRAIRKSDEKTKGTIIIPVFLDEISHEDWEGRVVIVTDQFWTARSFFGFDRLCRFLIEQFGKLLRI